MFILAPCPQCGGEIEFLDEAQATRCIYCGSLLHLVGTDEDRRYYLEPRVKEADIVTALREGFRKKGTVIRFTYSRLVFYPYWWVKGMVFKWMLGKEWEGERFKVLKTRLLDHTFPAHTTIPVGPPTLGVRTSSLRVRAFNTKEMQQWGLPLPVTISHTQAVACAEEAKDYALTLDKDEAVTEMQKVSLIGERYSLIYLPVWTFAVKTPQGTAELFIDALSSSVIQVPRQQGAIIPLLNDEALGFEFQDTSFIPLRCPLCGWDLPFHPYNVIHLCSNCSRAWRERGGSFQEASFAVAKQTRGTCAGKKVYLPFWIFQTTLETPAANLTTMADFYQYFPVPRTIDWKREQTKPIMFYIPAFRIKNIPVVSKFSAMMTRLQPQYDYDEAAALINHDTGDVFLSSSEARQMAELVLYALVPITNRRARDLVSQARLTFTQERLELFPFLDKGASYLDQMTGYALQKNAVDIH